MVAAVAGISDVGMSVNPETVKRFRQENKVAFPEDLGITRTDATRSLLAAGSVAELVEWSGGLYNPPARFRSW